MVSALSKYIKPSARSLITQQDQQMSRAPTSTSIKSGVRRINGVLYQQYTDLKTGQTFIGNKVASVPVTNGGGAYSNAVATPPPSRTIDIIKAQEEAKKISAEKALQKQAQQKAEQQQSRRSQMTESILRSRKIAAQTTPKQAIERVKEFEYMKKQEEARLRAAGREPISAFIQTKGIEGMQYLGSGGLFTVPKDWERITQENTYFLGKQKGDLVTKENVGLFLGTVSTKAGKTVEATGRTIIGIPKEAGGLLYQATVERDPLGAASRGGRGFIRGTFDIPKLLPTKPEEAIGGLAGSLIFFKGMGKIAKHFPLKTEKINLGGGYKTRAFGVEMFGKSKLLGGKVTKPSGKVEVFIGKPSQLMDITKMTEGKVRLFAPKTAIGTKALSQQLGLSKSGKTRIGYTQKIIRRTKFEKGIPVKEAFFDVEGLKYPKKSSKVIEKIAGKEGKIFGSAVEQRLPKGYRRKIGDVDVFFEGLSEKQIASRVSKGAKELKLLGENVRVSPSNPLVIEIKPKVKGTQGIKIFEAKAGVSPSLYSGSEIAPTGALGFEFPNIKGGQIGKTVKLGKTKSITIGEQVTRKGAGTSMFRGKTTSVKTPKEFSAGGLLPKGTRFKDLPDFVRESRGIAKIQISSKNPIKRLVGKSTKTKIEGFMGTFTTKQRKVIETRIAKDIGKPISIPLSKSPSISSINIKSPSLVVKTESPSISTSFVKSPSPIISKTKSVSPIIKSPSPVSPKFISPSISPKPIRKRGYIPSYKPASPRTKSPLIKSPIPIKLKSTSPRLTRSPRSPYISKSPSPSYRYSPSITTTFKPPYVYKPSPRPSRRGARIKLKPAYDVQIRRFGKWGTVKVGLPFGKAKLLGASRTGRTLARTFRLKPRGLTSLPDVKFTPSKQQFRRSKKPTSSFEWTEKKEKALKRGSGEVPEIIRFKKIKKVKFL